MAHCLRTGDDHRGWGVSTFIPRSEDSGTEVQDPDGSQEEEILVVDLDKEGSGDT